MIKDDAVNILIVDDRAENLVTLEAILGEAGANLVSASSGEDALKRVLETDFAVILLDVRMPGMSGFEIARLLRGRQLSRHTPIIFLTANTSDEFAIEEAYSLGAVDYLVKPFLPIVLRTKVAVFVELFRRTREARAAERRAAEAAVREQSVLWRTTLASIGDAVIATDPEGRVTFLNPIAEALTGWPATDALGQPLTEVFRIVNETTRVPVDNPALRSLKTGAIVGLANHTVLIARDGTEKPIDDSAAPIRDDAGEVSGAVLVFRDITERKLAEVAQARLAAIVESSDDAIIGKTLGGIIQFWNAGAERIFGYTTAEAVGQSITLIVPPERLAEEREILARIRSGERIDHFETVRVAKGGGLVDISLTVSPIRDHTGHIIGASKVARDVTNIKRAERTLAEARRRSETALQAGEVGTYYWNIVADQVTGDRNFVAMFGVLTDDRPSAPVGDFLAVIHADDRERVGTEIRRTLETDEPFHCEYRIITRIGERWVHVRGAVERNASGEPIAWTGVLVDISRQREVEDRLRLSEERRRLALDAAGLGTWNIDAATSALTTDERFRIIFHGSLDPITFEQAFAAIHADDRERVRVGVAAAMEPDDPKPYAEEYRVIHPDAAIRWVSGKGRANFEHGESERRLASLDGIVSDITDRVNTEERFRSLFDSMDEGYCVIQLEFDDEERPIDYRYLLVNPAFVQHTGIQHAAGRSAREIMPGHETYWFEAYGRVALTGESVRFVNHVADLGRWMEVSAFRVGAPEARQIAVLFSDVSARHRAENELRASERRLTEVFQYAPAFMAVLGGPEHIFERTNVRYDQLVGGRELIGKTVKEALPEVAGQGYIDLLDHVYRTGESYRGSDALVTFEPSDGGPPEERYVDFVYQPLRDANGEVTGIIVQGIDQTDRKRTEALLREKDQRLELFLGNAADYAVVITDPAGRILDWLGGAEVITGFAANDVVGKQAHVFFTVEDRAAGLPEREMVTAARDGRAEDKRWHQKKDGSQFYADGVMVPLRDEDGSLRGYGKVFRDVTARKRGEEAVQFLSNASASLAELVDYESTLGRIANLAVGGFADWCVVDVLDVDGARRRLAVTTAEPEDDAARSAIATFRPEDEAVGVVPHVLRTGEPEVVFDLAEVGPATAPQGPTRVAALIALGIRSYLCTPLLSRGRVIGGMTFLSSSFKRRFGSEELRVAQSLAERVTIAIENAQLYRTLQDQDRRKDEFLATLAHELRNPLAPVRNGIQILRMSGSDGPSADQALAMMDRQLGQMAHLIDDLMDLSRVSSGKVVLRKESIALRTIIDAAVETTRPAIEFAGHELALRIPGDPLIVEADRTRLVQVLANLLNNAAKYTPQGGRIALSLAQNGRYAVVRVVDTGVGIPAAMLPKVFDMFTQVGTSLERSQGGLGIGLTLVKRLVMMHGGSVSAESPGPGKGSTFTVRLPLAALQVQTPDALLTMTSRDKPINSFAVLVVDDNRDSAESMALLLKLLGHKVHTAHDGPEALRVLATFRPNLILLDLGLPGMSGYEVARRIRDSTELQGVTLVALTGWGQEEDRRRTREAGFDHHLVKPADPAGLERILSEMQPGG